MSRLLVVVLVCALSMTSVSFGFDSIPSANSPGVNNGWPVPKPSGLRFSDPTTSVQTGGVDGAVACSGCGQFGTCIPWQLLPWYGSWDDGHQRQGAGCRRCGFAKY